MQLGYWAALQRNEEKKGKKKTKEGRGEKERHENSWHKRDYFQHFNRNRGNSRKAVCVLNMNTAFGYYLNKV